jgi:hydrogenase maturation protease
MKTWLHREHSANAPVTQSSTEVVVAGFGSPHGDDRVGWRVIELLSRGNRCDARLATISDGSQLVPELDSCRKLFIVDGCRSGLSAGSITRLSWPDARIGTLHNRSTHTFSVLSALRLAQQLNRLPARVDIFGIEIVSQAPLGPMSLLVAQAAHDVARLIAGELDEARYA